jgi:Tfp pilus assembly protein PilF
MLVAAVFLLYSGILNAPWYLDDIPGILELPYLNDIGQAFRSLFAARGLAKLTFALNYAWGGLSLPGFHLVNIAIHAAAAVVLYLIFKRVFRNAPLFALLGALLFAVHPVQTHSVTYIVQRMTSLSGLFFLLALYLYVRFSEQSRQASPPLNVSATLFWLASLLSGALAMMSKENAVVLPAALFLYDWYFLDGRSKGVRALLIRILPFVVVPCLFAAFYLFMPLLQGKAVKTVAMTSPIISSRNLTPLTYFVTEFSVIWTYLRILAVPYGITLDYCYPVVSKILTLRTVIAGSGLAGLLLLAWRLRHSCPRVSFGIAWFFLTLSVESTFIPLDPLFIHRLYLPVAGFVIVMLDVLVRLPWRRGVMVAVSAMICVLALLTWQRNVLWTDPMAFNQDNLRKAPHSERVRVRLADDYLAQGRNQEAKPLLLEALRINPEYSATITSLSRIYAEEGNYMQALELLEKAVRTNPEIKEYYNNLGVISFSLGNNDMAEQHFLKAISLSPTYWEPHCSLGMVYAKIGRLNEAEMQFRYALKVSPEEKSVIRYNLGLLLLTMKRIPEARAEFDTSMMFGPKDGSAIYQVANAWLSLGNQQEARLLLPRLQRINGALAAKLASEIQGIK